MNQLNGKKIAMLLAEGVEDLEFYVPLMRLQEEGAEVLPAGLDMKPVRGKNGLEIKPTVTIDALKADELFAILLPGGWAPDKLRRYPQVTNLVHEMNASNKVIAKRFVEQQLTQARTQRSLSEIMNQAKTQFHLSRVAIRGQGQQMALEFYASQPETIIASPDPSQAAPASTPSSGGGTSRVSVTGGDAPTPYGAVRAVYGANVQLSSTWPKVRELSWVKPASASAVIVGPRPGGDRPSLIGTSGQVGADEHYAVHGVSQSYDGGHLIGLQLAGNDTNVPANLAPQRGSFNRGTYLQIETMVRESPVGPAGQDQNQPINMSVTVSYPGSGISVPYADLVSRGMIANNAPNLGPVTIPRRVPNRWTIRLHATTPGFVLTTRTAGSGTQMETQNRGVAAENATFIKSGDRFVWWRTSAPASSGASVGGAASETIVAEQATP